MPKVAVDFDRMNITFATLFPDLDGAARQANLANYADALRMLANLIASTPPASSPDESIGERPGGQLEKE